jgi:hypothetical protein
MKEYFVMEKNHFNEIEQKVAVLKAQYGLRSWWASEVADGGMTIEEALASQKAHDEMVRKMAETDATETESTVEAFLERLKFAESIR